MSSDSQSCRQMNLCRFNWLYSSGFALLLAMGLWRERGLFTRGETPVLANEGGQGRLLGWLGHGRRKGVFTSLPLFACCKGAQKKQEFRVAS